MSVGGNELSVFLLLHSPLPRHVLSFLKWFYFCRHGYEYLLKPVNSFYRFSNAMPILMRIFFFLKHRFCSMGVFSGVK